MGTELKCNMTPKLFAEKMKKLNIEFGHADPEALHGCADDLMCLTLTQLGYKEGVEIFEDMNKKYS
jgi:hypothetical protein